MVVKKLYDYIYINDDNHDKEINVANDIKHSNNNINRTLNIVENSAENKTNIKQTNDEQSISIIHPMLFPKDILLIILKYAITIDYETCCSVMIAYPKLNDTYCLKWLKGWKEVKILNCFYDTFNKTGSCNIRFNGENEIINIVPQKIFKHYIIKSENGPEFCIFLADHRKPKFGFLTEHWFLKIHTSNLKCEHIHNKLDVCECSAFIKTYKDGVFEFSDILSNLGGLQKARDQIYFRYLGK